MAQEISTDDYGNITVYLILDEMYKNEDATCPFCNKRVDESDFIDGRGPRSSHYIEIPDGELFHTETSKVECKSCISAFKIYRWSAW